MGKILKSGQTGVGGSGSTSTATGSGGDSTLTVAADDRVSIGKSAGTGDDSDAATTDTSGSTSPTTESPSSGADSDDPGPQGSGSETNPTEDVAGASDIPSDNESGEDEPSDAKTPLGKARAEAAKYRTRLRETETERDSLRESLTALQKQVAEGYAARILGKPEGLWLSGITPGDLVGADGRIDATAVEAAAAQAVEQFGLAKKPARSTMDPAGADASSGRDNSFASAFRL